MKVYLNKLVSSLFIFLLMTMATVTQAKDGAIIVFDASGSMWGQIKGKTKIEIARDVMGTLVKDWNEDIELGLIAYGHRKKGNCNDIEILQKVSTVDSDKILQTINKISPKGKTPISQSLRKAAETLRYTEDSATVILISDGEETCNADPCVVSKELEAKGINFTTHVIGFDIKNNKKAREQLKCIAENTGGEFFQAEDASSLKKALIKVKKAVVDPRPTLCKTYAENAVKQERTNIEKECSFKGKFWTTEYSTHFDWCMEQEIGSVAPNKEKQARIDALKKCQKSKTKVVKKSCKKFDSHFLPQILSKSHDYYNRKSNKALFVSRNEGGCYTFGYVSGKGSEKQAIKEAFKVCNNYKVKLKRVGTCELYIKNNTIVSSDLKQALKKMKVK